MSQPSALLFSNPPPGGSLSNNPDLFHEKLTWTGLDISRIDYGSDCTQGNMRNDYAYDKDHRVLTQANTVFTAEGPQLGRYNMALSYDPAGNILTMGRNGMIAPGDFGQIDAMKYGYDWSSGDKRLASISDEADPAGQPKGYKPTFGGYGYDGNGNATADGNSGASIKYNLLNLPKNVSGPDGSMTMDYTFGGEKIKKVVDGVGGETRLYLGGVEYKDGSPEYYSHGEGRVLLTEGTVRFQYSLSDHPELSGQALGDLMVFFEDKDGDGTVKTEAAGGDSEVLQRHFYYPFGMGMEGGWAMQDVAENKYQYNGKEMEKGAGLGWYAYGFRYYDAVIGRFPGVDPIADRFAWVTTYNYAENEPIGHIDLWGLQKALYPNHSAGVGLGNPLIQSGAMYTTPLSDWIVDSGNGKLRPLTWRAHKYESGWWSDPDLVTPTFGEILKDLGNFATFAMPAARFGLLRHGSNLIDDAGRAGSSVDDISRVEAVATERVLLINTLPVSTNGKLLGSITKGKITMEGSTLPAGQFDFVVMQDGKILLGKKHTYLSGGADVLAAGELKLRGGNIVAINNLSGHYLPGEGVASEYLNIRLARL